MYFALIYMGRMLLSVVRDTLCNEEKSCIDVKLCAGKVRKILQKDMLKT